jgi:integral membrane sensor domain MASE1
VALTRNENLTYWLSRNLCQHVVAIFSRISHVLTLLQTIAVNNILHNVFMVIATNNNYNSIYTQFQTTAEYLAFAAISKLIAAAATYPYQVIRTRLQDQNHTYKGTWVSNDESAFEE